MYGSGYASYVYLFCYKKDGSSTTQKDSVYYTKGISIYICRLAPVAVFGEDERTKHSRGGSYGFLRPDLIGSTPKGVWQAIVETLQRNLGSYNISMLGKDYVSRELPFKANIPTILNEGTFKIFDAFFYWED